MRAIAVMMLVFALSGIGSGIARAADQDKFDRLIGKYASENSGCVPGLKLKAACVCTNPPGIAGTASLTGSVVLEPGTHLLQLLCYGLDFEGLAVIDAAINAIAVAP